jgi:molybdenum cofactor synthesis domain-containing protein
LSIRVGILTISDRSSRGEREDLSGPALRSAVNEKGWSVPLYEVIPDDFETIKTKLLDWSENGDLDMILTTGGTGLAARDVTPDATKAVIQRRVPGLAEAMRAGSMQITFHAMLSRAIAGVRNRTLIINLPGSPKGALENLKFVESALPHAVELLREDPGAESSHRKADRN